jgi:2,3-bisphosphoglycerate-dependent phosphoglycerate mutase
MSMGKLIIVRHGESEWNATGQWTGLTDVNLTAKGRHEAELMGEQLRNIRIDHAFTSEQIRTVQTLEGVLKGAHQTTVSYDRRWGINERDYGEYTGLNKWQVKEEVGEEAFNAIRRNWDYPVPGGETLHDVYKRAVPFLQKEVLPMLAEGKNVLLVAHGNSIRSLIKYIEKISDEGIASVEMIFGTILFYDLDKDGHMVAKDERKIDTVLPPA